jgi:hypothetical protein
MINARVNKEVGKSGDGSKEASQTVSPVALWLGRSG